MPWWIWLLIAIVAFVGESATMALYLLYFGIAALVVAGLTLLGVLPLVQLLAFAVLSVGLLGVVRPRTLHLMVRQVPRGMLTNPGVRPDREAVVVEDVSSGAGMVRLGNAEFWTARAYQPGARLPKGTRVRVVYVDGLTAFVEAVEELPPVTESASASVPARAPDETIADGARQ
jgi:membrane protein implicated in regulation of membrane protease activity